MPNQKGSLKDRIRSWNLFLKYKKEKRKKEQELKKKEKKKNELLINKKYSKPKVFFLTILGLFLGLFEPKEKKNKVDIEKEIVNIEIKLNNNNLVIDDVKKVEKLDEILTLKKTPQVNNYKKRLEVIKEAIKKEEVIKMINTNTVNQIKLEKDKKELNKDLHGDIVSEKPNKKIIKNNNYKKSVGIYIPILEVKELNKDIDKCSKKINDLNNRIKIETEYNNLFDYEFEIKQLKLKIENIVIKYENLKKLPGFKELDNYVKIKEIDLYNIRKDDKLIKSKIKLCDETLKELSNKKQEIIVASKTKIVNKEVNKPKEQKEIKEEVKEIKKEEKNNNIYEIALANKIIYDNLIKEQKKITKLERSLSKISIKKRKPTIFYYTKNMISSIFNFTFGLFPLSLFKNKMLGGLVSGVMLNNSLRSVKKILNPEVEVTYLYEDLTKQISSSVNYLNRMDFLLSDSLTKVNDIRESVISQYGNDDFYQISLISYLNELDKIQSKIEFEREKIFGLNQDLDVIYKKNKQKVLTIKNHNSQ